MTQRKTNEEVDTFGLKPEFLKTPTGQAVLCSLRVQEELFGQLMGESGCYRELELEQWNER